MSKDKNRKYYLESSSKDNKEKGSQTKLEFDLYFRKLMSKNKKVYAHHKAPMRKYAEQKGLTIGTEEEFDKIFKDY